MATYLTINGINLIVVPDIDTDYQIRMAELDYIGQNGSYTKGLGNKGRLLDFDVYVRPSDVQTIINLKNSDSKVKVVSKSKAGYNGYYQIKKFTSKEKLKHFIFSIQLQEYTTFNITTKTFINWKVTKKSTKSSKTSATTSLYKYLLKCPTLKYGSSNTKCVKVLQRMLRLNGYYITYKGSKLNVDGDFKKYTRWAVKLFQKEHKLKQDGIVGPKTKAKFKGKIGASTSSKK
ncbi:hypothetical protein SDC9_30530 [bioreactor metagenome]|uniref:Peptidoglycan binding-like domain-containing protein n=1 Tax=bioreactor metagenome TaxID=1076179 RepID=A0A644V0P0_9ZZZZ|nr:peptidoglycan-binding domain-containing protein [Methanobrevibacter sp.]MEA4957537.1 peptidoglycan-binding domain-containing protein [Methanobrevibacter sp.]